jgi:hypothetical protein|tara:strand:+ start:1250 stop:1579 length:330 start_codon:yes stop_codon:yes gene_type:complete
MPNVTEFHPERNNDEWRSNVESLLKTGNGKFHFQKVDGSLRDMYCTLNPNVLPESGNTEPPSQAKPGILTVFDIEKDGWRSMRYENVIGFKFLGDQTTDPEHESTFIQQ